MASAQKKNQSGVSHFSHPHPLERVTASNPISCSGCKLRVSTNGEDCYYRCKIKTCNFTLHSVCYNMPFITTHPSHPTHDLLLFLGPSSSPLNTCFACKNHATGLTYHCAECAIFFHPLCLSLPLSLAIKRHSHKVKLEFSPPYEFYCDFCSKPSYTGWLYRCSMCEFDIHIACAIDNLEDPQLEHKTEYTNNIMRLVAQQVGGGISRTQEDCDGGITGSWNKKLQNQRKKRSLSSGKIAELELQETEQCPLRDKLSPLSDLMSPATPSASHQFNDSYFSIDLTKSYSNSAHERRNQVPKEGTECIVERAEEPCDLVKWSSTDSCNSHKHQNKMNEALFKGGIASDFGEPKHVEVVKYSNKDDQIITEPESKRCSRSCWRKLLTCCH